MTRLGDFILQEDSPAYSPSDGRPRMGSQSVYATMKPNFAPLLKLIAIMTSDKEMIEKYPLSDLDK